MNKNVKLILMSFILIIPLSCNQESIYDLIPKEKLESDLMGHLIEFDHDVQITRTTKSLGGNGVLIENHLNKSTKNMSFKIETERGFYLKGEYLKLSDYNYTINNGFIEVEEINNLALGTRGSDLLVKKYGEIELLSKKSDLKNTKEFLILIVGLNEIISNDKSIVEQITESSKNKMICSFSDTYVTVETGTSRSVAEENGKMRAKLDNTLIEYAGSSCVQIGSTDISCVWGDHLCVATNTYCCPDNDPPY